MSLPTWRDAPYVFVVAPACPFCGSPSYITVRSESGGDGSVMRKAVCRDCSSRFRIVVELPSSGSGGGDAAYPSRS